MYCNHCGKQIPNISQFCPHCGKSINQGQYSSEKTDSPFTIANSSAIKTKKPRNKIIMIVIMCLVGIVALIYMGVFVSVKIDDHKLAQKIKDDQGYIDITEIKFENIKYGNVIPLPIQKHDIALNSQNKAYVVREGDLQTLRVRVKYNSLLSKGQRTETFDICLDPGPWEITMPKTITITSQSGEFYVDFPNLQWRRGTTHCCYVYNHRTGGAAHYLNIINEISVRE